MNIPNIPNVPFTIMKKDTGEDLKSAHYINNTAYLYLYETG